MAATQMQQAQFPQINPTGTGGTGNYNWGNAGNTMSSPVSSGVNTFQPIQSPSQNPQGSYGGLFGVPGGGTQYTGQAASFGNELGKIYGKGVGSLLYQFFQTGGGFNAPLTEQAINAEIAAMQHQINAGYGNLETQLGQQGLSPGGSAAALAQGDYFSNAVTQENAITAQEFYNMWNASMDRETSILGELMPQAGHYKANAPTLLSSLGSIGSMASSAGGAIGSGLQAAGVGAGGGTMGGIVDFLAALAI
jgi:hypothetical protein